MNAPAPFVDLIPACALAFALGFACCALLWSWHPGSDAPKPPSPPAGERKTMGDV